MTRAWILYKVPVWLPIKSLGAVNVYAFSSDDGSLDLVDSGILSGRSITSFVTVLKRGGLDPCKIRNIYITHFHVDHSTMSLFLHRLSNARLFIGAGDYRVIEKGVESFVRGAVRLFIEHGMSREEAETIFKNHPAVRLADTYRELIDVEWNLLREDDEITLGKEKYRVIELPGHTPGHIGLLSSDGSKLFSGDVVLERITPHVTIHDWRDNPLKDYLDTLYRIKNLGVKVIHPGHREDITDPVRRINELLEHHKTRLGEILEVLRKEGRLTGYEIAKRIKWRVRYSGWNEYPYAERFFAMGEALAHLRYLEVEGLVTRKTCGASYCFASI